MLVDHRYVAQKQLTKPTSTSAPLLIQHRHAQTPVVSSVRHRCTSECRDCGKHSVARENSAANATWADANAIAKSRVSIWAEYLFGGVTRRKLGPIARWRTSVSQYYSDVGAPRLCVDTTIRVKEQ